MVIPPNLSRSVIRMRYSAISSFGVSPGCHTEDTRFREHAHRVRVINPTIPWITLPNRIAPFGGGVPGAICDRCRRTRSTVHVAGRTVNNDNTRGPIDRQRGRSCRFGRGKCVRLIVDVPRTEKSGNCEGKKAEKRIQVELFEQGLQFLSGGHCLRLSV